MIGRRVYGKEPHEFEPGDYGRWERDDNNWYAETPNGHGANLSSHHVVEHEDGTITVSPSIAVSTTSGGIPEQVYHGFLERGVWRNA